MPEANRSPFSRIVDALELRRYLTRADILRAALIVSAVVPFLLVAPRPREATRFYWMLTIVELGGPVHVVKNVDSWEFEHDAEHPGDLFTFAHRHWQSRPLSIGLGWLLSQPFRLAGMPTKQIMTPEQGRELVGKPPYPSVYNAYSPQYAGYILMNWMILVVSVLLLKPLLRGRSFFEPRVFPAVSLLLVNMVTKAFFWTPHVQIFSVLLGVASLILIRPLLPRARTLRLRDASLIGVVIGIGSLAYGAFAVAAGSAALVILFGDGKDALMRELRRRVTVCLTLLSSFFVPAIVWAGILVLRTGAVYSPETQRYHEFVWIYEQIPNGPRVFLPLLAKHLSSYIGFAVHVAIIPSLLMAALVIFFYRLQIPERLVHSDDDSRHAAIFYLIANSAFYASMGFYAERLAWTITPALLLILGLQMGLVDSRLTGKRRLLFRAAVIATGAGYAIHYIAKSGPFA